jgi:hypothetical protein
MRNTISITEFFLAFLALILLSVSFYQTWIGLQQIFGPASMPIALVLSSLLLLLCILLRNAKLKQGPVGGLMAIYIFIALFCFTANFNALYTRFMRTDIYTTQLRDINEKYNNLESDVQGKLNYKYPKETAQNVEIKKKQLMEQIQDKGNPGIGDRAKSLIRDIEKLLGDKVDLLEPVNKDWEDLATRMGKQIDGMISNLSPTESDLKADINKAVLKWNKKIQDVLLLSKNDKDDLSQGTIDEAITEYNKLGNRAHTVLGDDKYKFTPCTSTTQDIGKIGYAFSHAIQNFGIYQFVVLMGCILLDFLIPIIILLITKPDNITSNNTGIRRRKGGVITPNN